MGFSYWNGARFEPSNATVRRTVACRWLHSSNSSIFTIVENEASGVLLYIRIIRDVFHDISYIAIQYPAKNFDGMSTNAFIPLQSGNLPGADIVLLNKRILRHALLLHYLPEIVIGNHNVTPSPLDIVTDYGI